MPADDCFTHALTEPAIEDIDVDGGLEVVVSTTENALVTYDAKSGEEEWRVSLPTYGYGRPTIANVTPADGPEVVTADIEGNVVVTRGDGSVEWRFALNSTPWKRATVLDAPRVRDFDADGRPEVLVGSSKGLVLLTADGQIEWRQNASALYLAAAQADDDPALEIFTAGSSTLRAYDGSNGTEEWRRESSNARVRVAADVDGDDTVELYVSRLGGEVLALDAETGDTEWTTSVLRSDDAMVPPPVLGDVTGDGSPEIVVTTEPGTVSVLDAHSGEEVGRYERNVFVWTFPTPADIDGDGHAEILVRYGDGRVVALDWRSGRT